VGVAQRSGSRTGGSGGAAGSAGGSAEARVRGLGLRIPEAPAPAGSYVPGVLVDSWLYVSGQLPMAGGAVRHCGKVGLDLGIEEAREAAQLCALNALGVARSVLGSLDRVQRVVKVTAFVNSGPGFTSQPQVANGASDLLASVFGEAGRHARTAAAAPELPLDAAVEIDVIFRVAMPDAGA
jgi:enamine deaminase RidA (YjgF/YER057c/UK114 family)